MPKVSWNAETGVSIVERDPKKICQECGGYEGHFNHCKTFQQELKSGKWD